METLEAGKEAKESAMEKNVMKKEALKKEKKRKKSGEPYGSPQSLIKISLRNPLKLYQL